MCSNYLAFLENRKKKDAAKKKQKTGPKAKKQKVDELSYEIQAPTSKILGEIKGYEASFINLNQATLFEYLLVTGTANGLPFKARKAWSPNPTDTEEYLDLDTHCAILIRGKTQWTRCPNEIDEIRWENLRVYLSFDYGVELVRLQEEVPAFALEGLPCNTNITKTTLHWEKASSPELRQESSGLSYELKQMI